MAMDLNAKAAYIRGLMTGMEFDPASKNGKVIAAMMDLLEEMAAQVVEHDNALDQVYDELETLDQDVDDIVSDLYADDDEDDEDLEELSALDGDALREVLIQRLIAYKQFKGAAAALGARMQAESRMHPRVAGPDPEFLGLMPDYLAGITLRGLAVICADLDGKRQTFLLEAEHVAPHRVPLDLTVASVDRFTMAHQTCTFRELLDGDATTEQLVVTFLAMLELAKRGSLTLSQDEIFGTIQINRVEGAEAYVPGEGPELTE